MQPFQHHKDLLDKHPLSFPQPHSPPDHSYDLPALNNPSAYSNTGHGNTNSHVRMSQEDICTQQDTQVFSEELEPSVPEDNPSPRKPNGPWARLISKHQSMPNYELLPVESDDMNRMNMYTLGRSALNKIRLDISPRISNKHCMIYCKENKVNPNHHFLEAYVEDTSANGTYINGINGEVQLTKGVPRLLKNGDTISLINPKLVNKTADVTTEDLHKSSFFVELLIRPASTIAARTRSHVLRQSSNGTGSVPLGRSNTVIRLLNQQRSIEDFYEIGEMIGQGGAGSVFRGVKKDTGVEWAVKLIDTRKLALSNSSASDITKEAEMLRSLRHPYIIHLEDIFADGHNLYLVMEYSRGGDLFDRVIQKRKYEEHEAKEVIRQILIAIEYLHDRKIAHRDLKPENILLISPESDINIKISDFGLAKAMDESGGFKSFCGTPEYFAPEVLQRKHTVRGEGRYDLKSDLWSVGVIMFVLLGGEFPFPKGTAQPKVNFGKPVWKTVSEDAKDLICKLLVAKPDKRIDAKQALQHVWIAYANNGDGSLQSASGSSSSGTGSNSSESMPPPNCQPDGSSSGKGNKQTRMRPPVPEPNFPPTKKRSIVETGNPPASTTDVDDAQEVLQSPQSKRSRKGAASSSPIATSPASKKDVVADIFQSPAKATRSGKATATSTGDTPTPKSTRKRTAANSKTPQKGDIQKYFEPQVNM